MAAGVLFLFPFWSEFLKLFLLCRLAAGVLGVPEAQSGLKNVVMIIADDLRPQLNASYGQKYMYTPNLDKFASESLTFNFAFTNFAICSPSRNSFLSGRRPDTTQVWNFINDFRQAPGGENWTSLPQYFKNNDYTTLGVGKLYHPGHPPNNDEPLSWSQDKPYIPSVPDVCTDPTTNLFCPFPDPENKSVINDYVMMLGGLEYLDYLFNKSQETDTPFFLGVGFHYPHMTWHVPQWTVDKYPPAEQIPLPRNDYAPTNMPPIAFTAEIDGMDNVSLPASLVPAGHPTLYQVPSPLNDTFPSWFQQQLRLGYSAAVTLTDSHIGEILARIDELGIANETLVLIFGDHGYQLGEHSEWAKHTNFDLACHVPLMVRAPWISSSVNQHTDSIIELIDLYRTVASLAGLPPPEQGVDGSDQSAVLYNPSLIYKNVSFSQYSRCPEPGYPLWHHNNCENVPADKIGYMGYSVRTPTWRYTEWFVWNGTVCSAEFDQPSIGRELYDHAGDSGQVFDEFENDNLAYNSSYAPVVTELRGILLAQFQKPSVGCPPSMPEDYVPIMPYEA